MKRYIDAEKLMDFAENHKNKSVDCNDIARFPSADVAPVVHGHVIGNGNPFCGPCSVCGKITNRSYNFCWSCGAMMDGGKDDG